MKKKILLIVLMLFLMVPTCFGGAGTIVTYTIDPEKNAYMHNNQGIYYMEERSYYAAIQEFKIAISLNPKKQATAVYFNNLGKAYQKIGHPELAVDCFKNSLTQYSMNFEYYKNLADCYVQLGQAAAQLKIYEADEEKNPLSKIMVGLLKEATGDAKGALIKLDEFSMAEPDLIITPAVKYHTRQLSDSLGLP